MKAERFVEMLGADFYAGVPDSQLRAFCDLLMHRYGNDPQHHIIAVNEGNAAALAAGYHLATGRVPVVYMQNSGEGNIINPAASLLSSDVYGIPVLFVIGWRGEPGVPDEPQHIRQGAVTLRLLEDMDIRSFVIGTDTAEEAVLSAMQDFRSVLAAGRQAAFVIRKGALTCEHRMQYQNRFALRREDVIRQILTFTGNDPVICTTGKASRELFELRTAAGETHARDFLTVGSMGHASSIALGIALQKPQQKLWCIDGDGAVLMHMGAMAVIGAERPENLVHIVLNNAAHETVGGMPTAAGQLDLPAAARAMGYPYAACAEDADTLGRLLSAARERRGLTLVEVRCALGARADLGRPTASPQENKQRFTQYLRQAGMESCC